MFLTARITPKSISSIVHDGWLSPSFSLIIGFLMRFLFRSKLHARPTVTISLVKTCTSSKELSFTSFALRYHACLHINKVYSCVCRFLYDAIFSEIYWISKYFLKITRCSTHKCVWYWQHLAQLFMYSSLSHFKHASANASQELGNTRIIIVNPATQWFTLRTVGWTAE